MLYPGPGVSPVAGLRASANTGIARETRMVAMLVGNGAGSVATAGYLGWGAEERAMYEDKTLQCRECGQEFVFSAGEQEFYQQKGLLNEPGRCSDCRQKRRAGMGQARGERAPREMHTITCAECGQEAQVPFLPRNDKPVYCSTCFEKVRAQ